MTVRTWIGAEGAPETRISVRPKRRLRAQFVSQALQDMPAVATVLAAGVTALRSEREGRALALAAAELLVGAWVLVTAALEARHLFGRERSHGHHEHSGRRAPPRVDVAGLAAAALGYVEVWHRAHERGHFKLVSPLMLSATAALFFALGGRHAIRRLARRREPHVLVTPTGVSYHGGRRRRWTVAWEDVAGVDHGPGQMTVRLHAGGAHVLRGDDHFGGGALLEEVREAVARHAPPHLVRAMGAARRGRSRG